MDAEVQQNATGVSCGNERGGAAERPVKSAGLDNRAPIRTRRDGRRARDRARAASTERSDGTGRRQARGAHGRPRRSSARRRRSSPRSASRRARECRRRAARCSGRHAGPRATRQARDRGGSRARRRRGQRRRTRKHCGQRAETRAASGSHRATTSTSPRSASAASAGPCNRSTTAPQPTTAIRVRERAAFIVSGDRHSAPRHCAHSLAAAPRASNVASANRRLSTLIGAMSLFAHHSIFRARSEIRARRKCACFTQLVRVRFSPEPFQFRQHLGLPDEFVHRRVVDRDHRHARRRPARSPSSRCLPSSTAGSPRRRSLRDPRGPQCRRPARRFDCRSPAAAPSFCIRTIKRMSSRFTLDEGANRVAGALAVVTVDQACVVDEHSRRPGDRARREPSDVERPRDIAGLLPAVAGDDAQRELGRACEQVAQFPHRIFATEPFPGRNADRLDAESLRDLQQRRVPGAIGLEEEDPLHPAQQGRQFFLRPIGAQPGFVVALGRPAFDPIGRTDKMTARSRALAARPPRSGRTRCCPCEPLPPIRRNRDGISDRAAYASVTAPLSLLRGRCARNASAALARRCGAGGRTREPGIAAARADGTVLHHRAG